MFDLLLKLFAPPSSWVDRRNEKWLIDDMKFSSNVKSIVEAIDQDRITFIELHQRYFYSKGRTITVEFDQYGPEVHVGGGPLLDCYPRHYNLDKESAMLLYNAILNSISRSLQPQGNNNVA